MSKYVLGFDFGTLSCRGVLLDLSDGDMIATAEHAYRHGVISGQMWHKPIPLADQWFLQDPDDWMESISYVSKTMIKEAGIDPADVIGVGTDFTSCTLLPVMADGTPLCVMEQWRDMPNAWPKLWKHHGAQNQAERIEKYAKENTNWLKKYFGNAVSSEWAYPKILQVVEEDPEIYKACDYFMEAVDYIVFKLTGQNCRTSGILGVNAFWIDGIGYPSQEFSAALNPLMRDVAETKLDGKIVKIGDCVGHVLPEMANLLGITENAVVAAGHSDGAVAGCGAGVTKSGSMMLVMGTSTCHQMMYRDFHSFDGVCSVAADGMVPGLYGYESGQPATGDVFSWFADNCIPPTYFDEANQEGQTILGYMGSLAEKILPGESGLVALDWLNGNRSILSNYNLSGTIVGLTMETKTEEIYRALVEANVFGSRRILENYEQNEVKISDIYVVGGIAKKSPWIMQMCADVFKQPIIVPMIDNVPARGSAACAAVAAGVEYPEFGCKDFEESSEKLIPKDKLVYYPNAEMSKRYDEVYHYYQILHDFFGADDSFMKGLKALRREKGIVSKNA